MKYRTWFALLLALSLTLLAGCGGQDEPAGSTPSGAEVQTPAPEAPQAEPEAPASAPESPKAEPKAPASAPEEPETEPEAPVPAPEAPAPEAPKPEPEAPKPEPEAPQPEAEPQETPPEDGSYTASVTLEGGTGRASVESPAKLRCEDGQFWATLVWSSPNFDYMKVDGVRYDQINTEGNSVFEIPVAAFDQKLDVVADTVAMSEPHEVEYTLYFDSASLQKQ